MDILALDIETEPAQVYVWNLYKPIIGVDQIIDPGGLLCWSAKWIGQKKTHFAGKWNGEQEMIDGLWDLLDKAEAVLHYNGTSFDVPHVQRAFMEAGKTPPSPFKQIDLLKTIRSKGRFLSNRLAHVSPQLGLDSKVEHEGFNLWRKVLEGDSDAQRRMRKYNIQDTVMLEELYQTLLPWIPIHPNHSIGNSGLTCPRCDSSDVQKRGFSTTSTRKYQRYQCQSCGGWLKDIKSLGGAEVVAI